MIATRDSLSLRAQATGLTRTNSTHQAVIKQTRAILAHPNDYKNYFKLAKHFMEQKNWERAIIMLKNVKQLCPERSISYPYHIKCLKNLERHEEALEVCQQYIKRDPDGWRPYNLYGSILGILNKHDEAISAYKESILRKEKEGTYIDYAKVLRRQGRFEEALEINNRAVAINPGNKNAVMLWGLILYYQLKVDEALEKVQQAEALGYQEWDLNFIKGLVYYIKEEYEEARKLFVEGVEGEKVKMQKKIRFAKNLQKEINDMQNRLATEDIAEFEAKQVNRRIKGNQEIIDLITEKENKGKLQ